MTTSRQRPRPPVTADDEALSWFAALQRACQHHDFALGSRAERALERLGFVVRRVRPIPHAAASERDGTATEAPLAGGPGQ